MKEGAAALKADSKLLFPSLGSKPWFEAKIKPWQDPAALSVTSLREATQLSSPDTVGHFPRVKADL